MLWFQKDSLDTVGFRTYDGGSRVLNQKVTFGVLNVPMGGGVISLGLSPKKYQFFDGFPKIKVDRLIFQESWRIV